MKQMNHLKVALRSAVATGVITVGVMALPLAQADIRVNTTGGTACQATNGNGAKLFNFGNLEAWNTSAGTQFLSCGGLSDINPVSSVGAVDIWYGLTNPTAASISFTCVIQTGYVGNVVNSAVYVKVVAAGTTDFVNSASDTTPVIPAREDSYSAYTMSCSVPAQGKLGLLSVSMPGTIT